MARYIHCNTCNEKMANTARKYGEWYESIEGSANRDMTCDLCGTTIKKDQACHAAVLLTDQYHPNYHHQKPDIWASEFITLK